MEESLRQGDIGCFERESVPTGYMLTGKPLVIRGESGRHLHRFVNVEVYTLQNSGANTAVMEGPRTGAETEEVPVAFIRAFEDAKVIHDVQGDMKENPHDMIKLRPGTIYAVTRARQHRGRSGD